MNMHIPHAGLVLLSAILFACSGSEQEASSGVGEAHSVPESERHCIANGFMDELACPFSVEELLSYRGADIGVFVIGKLTGSEDSLVLTGINEAVPVTTDGAVGIAVKPTKGSDFLRNREILRARGISLINCEVAVFGVFRSRDNAGRRVLMAYSIRSMSPPRSGESSRSNCQ